MSSRPVLVIGNGGHSAVLQDILRLTKTPFGVVEHHEDIGREHQISNYALVLGMGRRSARQTLAELFKSYSWATLIHPSAIVSPSATICEGAQIMAGAIIQANAFIGAHAIVNTGAQVDHGSAVGPFAHICPGAVLCADVRVEEGAMVGPGEVIRRGSRCLAGPPPYAVVATDLGWPPAKLLGAEKHYG